MNFDELVGRKLLGVKGLEPDSECVQLFFADGIARLSHSQDCCETVSVCDVCGDLSDLLDETLLLADEASFGGSRGTGDSETWTFYRLATNKGYVTIRWLGSSNGYYSEAVDFDWLPNTGDAT